VLGSEGKSSIIVHQGFSRIMMKNVAINKSVFDYYLYMNFICKYIFFFKYFFCIFVKCFVVDSLTFKFDGRLGRLVTTISFPSTPSSQHYHTTTTTAIVIISLFDISLQFLQRAVNIIMIRKSNKVHPSLSEDNNDQSLSSHQSENQLRPSENLNTSTEQVKLKKLRNFSKKLFLHYIT
jgi:hypothetical protein